MFHEDPYFDDEPRGVSGHEVGPGGKGTNLHRLFELHNGPKSTSSPSKQRTLTFGGGPDNGHSSNSEAQLQRAEHRVKVFQRKMAPFRLNPMAKYVPPPVSAADEKGAGDDDDESNTAGGGGGTTTAAAAAAVPRRAKRLAMHKFGGLQRKIATSRVETPSVLKYMKSLDYDNNSADINGTNNHTHPIAAASSLPLNHALMANQIIEGWCRSFDLEKSEFGSVSVFAEVRLREALAATADDHIKINPSSANKKHQDQDPVNGGPNHRQPQPHAAAKNQHTKPQPTPPSAVRAALCCDLLIKLSSLFGRYSGLMTTLTGELLRCIYVDYESVIAKALANPTGGIDARLFYSCSPYFDLVKSMELRREELSDELQLYNSGIDMRTALTKMSVGVRTMFNSARRTIRDITFRIWKNYVEQRRKNFRKLKYKIAALPYFNMWAERYRRRKERGYFYDTDTEDEKEKEEDEEVEEELVQPYNEDQDMYEMTQKGRQSLLLDIVKTADITSKDAFFSSSPFQRHVESPTSVSSDSGTHSPSPTMGERAHNSSFRRAKKTSSFRFNAAESPSKHKRFKVLSTTVKDARTVRVCESRLHKVELADVECQCDLSDLQGGAAGSTESGEQDAAPKNAEDNEEGEDVKAKDSKGGSSMLSLIGGKKEKPMSLNATMDMVPEIYEQYMVRLMNQDPGTHLNLVKFCKDALIRKFGIKQIAMKNLRAFVACLQTKKALEIPRLKLFTNLIGMGGSSNAKKNTTSDDNIVYDPKHVDFFFKKLLSGLFDNRQSEYRRIQSSLIAEPKEMDREAVRKKLELIFPNTVKIDAILFLRLEREFDQLPFVERKGLAKIDIDDVIVLFDKKWVVETIAVKLNKNNYGSLMTLQRRIRSFLKRRRAAKAEAAAKAETEAKAAEQMAKKSMEQRSPSKRAAMERAPSMRKV